MAVFKDKIKTKDGRSWYFSVYYSSLSGERKKHKSKKFLLKKEAEEAERIFLLKMTNKIEIKEISFKDLRISFENYQKDKVKITTFNNYKKFHQYLKSLDNINVNDFNISHFNQWRDIINNTNLSTTYKNNIYKFLRANLNFAEKMYNLNLKQILAKMSGFNNPNELKKEMQFWTYSEFVKFIEQEKDLKYRVYFETLYYCGLRKGEANALTWKDVDLENHTIHINKNVVLKIKGEEWILLPPKTKSSIRTLLLPAILEKHLKFLYENYAQYINFKNDWFVFGGLSPLKDTTVQNHAIKNCKEANIKKIRIHDFRHSCASLLINNGASIALVAKYLGHSDISTTLNTYTHMFKNEMSDIINIINNLSKGSEE